MCYRKKLLGINKGIFLFIFLLYQGFIFAQGRNNIKGDSLICLHFSYTYSFDNMQEASLQWYVKGGKIQGSSHKDSVSVLWQSKNKKVLKLVLMKKSRRNKRPDTLSLNIKELKIESHIIGPSVAVNDMQSNYKLKLLNGITPDYIHWSLSDDKAGCIIGNSDTTTCSVWWYNKPWNQKVTLRCRVGKCFYDFSQYKTLDIIQSSNIAKVKHEVEKDSLGKYRYIFKAVTKGNKAAEYIWDFGDNCRSITKNNMVSHRFTKTNDSIISIYVRVKDAANNQISPVYVYSFHIDKKVDLEEISQIPKIKSSISCSSTNNAYDIKLSTFYASDIYWNINGEYYGKEHEITLRNRLAGTKYKIELRNTQNIVKDSTTVFLPRQLPLANFDFENVSYTGKTKHPYICEGQSIKLVNLSLPDTLIYKWNFDDNTGSIAKNPYKTYISDPSSFQVHYINLEVWDRYGCHSDTVKFISVKDNTFQPIRPMNFIPGTVYVSSDSAYSTANISINFTGGTPPFKYRWFCGVQYVDNENNKILKRIKSRNAYYQAEVIDRFGCKYRFHLPPARLILKIKD